MRIVRSLDESVWRNFVEEHPDGSIFHMPEMFEVFARTKGFRPTLWAVVSRKQDVLALMLPVKITMMSAIARFFSTRATAFGSVLYKPDDSGREALALLLRFYRKNVDRTVLYTKLRHLTDMTAIQLLMIENGFDYEEHLNYLVSLDDSTDEIFRRINKSGRQSIRRSLKKGVTLQEVRDRSLIPVHYDLLSQTHLRARAPLADISLFKAVFDILVPKGMAKMLLAIVKNNYIAASLELPFKKTIYSWYSGYDFSYRKLYPNDYLVWRILKWGAENGYSSFDFGGVGVTEEDSGPRAFKAKFGGQKVGYGFNICTHAPVRLALGRLTYRFYRSKVFKSQRKSTSR